MLYSYTYYTIAFKLIQTYICPSSITCVNSMDVSYIPIVKARGFTAHSDNWGRSPWKGTLPVEKGTSPWKGTFLLNDCFLWTFLCTFATANTLTLIDVSDIVFHMYSIVFTILLTKVTSNTAHRTSCHNVFTFIL